MKQSILKKPSTFKEIVESDNGDADISTALQNNFTNSKLMYVNNTDAPTKIDNPVLSTAINKATTVNDSLTTPTAAATATATTTTVPKNVRFLGIDLVKSADSSQFEQETNDGENYLNENNQNLGSASSYNQQGYVDFGNGIPIRNFYKKSKSIPFKQINIYGNIEQEFNGNSINSNNLTSSHQYPSNHFASPVNNNITSPSYIQQLRQHQNLQYNKYQQNNLAGSNQFYFNQPNLQYHQLARGLRINSANNLAENTNYVRESTNRSPQQLSTHYTHLTNKTSLGNSNGTLLKQPVTYASNFNSNNLNNGNSNNNYYYYVYSKKQQLQQLNQSQNNLVNHHSNLHLNTHLGGLNGSGISNTGSYVLNYPNGTTTPTSFIQTSKSLAASSAALIANKSKLKHRMSASSISISSANTTTANTPTPSITPMINNNFLSHSQENYNMTNQDVLPSKSSAASLTLYTYLLQTNKNIGKDIKASVIRSQTKKLGRNSPGLNVAGLNEDLELNKQAFVSRLEKMSHNNNSSLSTSSLNNLGNGNIMRNSNYSREQSNISIKNLFKESTNSTSQRSGSASSLIANLNSDLTNSNSNGLVTTLLRLNQHR